LNYLSRILCLLWKQLKDFLSSAIGYLYVYITHGLGLKRDLEITHWSENIFRYIIRSFHAQEQFNYSTLSIHFQCIMTDFINFMLIVLGYLLCKYSRTQRLLSRLVEQTALGGAIEDSAKDKWGRQGQDLGWLHWPNFNPLFFFLQKSVRGVCWHKSLDYTITSCHFLLKPFCYFLLWTKIKSYPLSSMWTFWILRHGRLPKSLTLQQLCNCIALFPVPRIPPPRSIYQTHTHF
jgi:hypothetical protein